MQQQRHTQKEKSAAHAETGGEGESQFASPACYAHEMDPAYMWASPQSRPRSLQRIIDLLKRGRRA
jgi:hypothetical protein